MVSPQEWRDLLLEALVKGERSFEYAGAIYTIKHREKIEVRHFLEIRNNLNDAVDEFELK